MTWNRFLWKEDSSTECAIEFFLNPLKSNEWILQMNFYQNHRAYIILVKIHSILSIDISYLRWAFPRNLILQHRKIKCIHNFHSINEKHSQNRWSLISWILDLILFNVKQKFDPVKKLYEYEIWYMRWEYISMITTYIFHKYHISWVMQHGTFFKFQVCILFFSLQL